MTEPLDILAAVRDESEAAADRILTAATTGLQDLSALRDGGADALDRIEAQLLHILEACAFQDIVGQRLARLETLLAATAPVETDPLLNGPADAGQGLDQSAADRLLAEISAAPRGR